ncbi:MAG: serpin family protein [Eubacteriales bacterium]|nr:serpin family protein [Eubacteriales bacterium]
MKNQKRKNHMRRLAAAGVCGILLAALAAGCSAEPENREAESENRGPEQEERGAEENAVLLTEEEREQCAAAAAEFGLRLFSQAAGQTPGANVCVSPVSALEALGMTAAGAEGDTKTQMEDVFGMPEEKLAVWLSDWSAGLPAGKESTLRIANSLWMRDDGSFTVDPDFTEYTKRQYGAEICEEPFDGGTAGKINEWVKQSTDGMIDGIVDDIPANAMLYLVNGLAFEGEWETLYREDQIGDGTFTGADGNARDVQMMYAQEQAYVEDDQASGFVKYYKGGEYAFAALLPEEGLTVEDYAATLTGERLRTLFLHPQETEVDTAIPQFESDYGAELSGMLKAMGMKDAFDPVKARFGGMGTSEQGNLFIGQALHKTHMTVDESGTKAAAVTAVMMESGAAMTEQVYLNRPFLYFLIDCRQGVPLFVGTLSQ